MEMKCEPLLVDLARATGKVLAERFREEIKPPFSTEEISTAAADLVEACIAEFRTYPSITPDAAQALGDVAALAFLSTIDEIENGERGSTKN